MTPERWTRVKALFHQALEVPYADRQTFLAAQCAGDDAPEELRAEVARLLSAHTSAGGFIEQSPVAGTDGVSLLTRTIAPMTGRTIGRYTVEHLIGAGGMGQVYAARDSELGRPVALKVAFGHDEDSHARLRREAQHASRLNHPHICTIHEVGSFEGQPFIVMELVEGRRLTDAIPPDGLPVTHVVRYGQQIADALAHAHHAGVTHGDLKSVNVIVTPEDRVKVLDFGLSRRSAQEVKDLSQSEISTADASAAGTLSCMAPELLRGAAPDPPSDVWALGVLLHQMASGRQPFTGATGFELSGAILHQPPAALPAHVPPSLHTVIERCLSKQRDARFQQAGDVRAALGTLEVRPAAGVSRWLATTSARWQGAWRGRAAVAATVAAIVGAGVYGLTRSDGEPSSPSIAAGVPTSSPEAARLYAEGIQARHGFRMADAERALTEAVTLDPTFAQAYLPLAAVVDNQGARRAGEVRQYLLKAAQLEDRLPEPDRLLLRTEMARMEGNFADAGRRLEELLAAHPETEAAYEVGVRLYSGPLASQDKVLALTRAGAEALPISPMTRNLYGFALFATGRFPEALREFEAYARLAPREPEPYIGLSRTYMMMGLPEKAADAAGEALAIDPGFEPAREARASAFGAIGRFNDAMAEDPPGPFFDVVLLTGAGRYREADAHAVKVRQEAEINQDTDTLVRLNVVHCRAHADRGAYDLVIQTCGAAATAAARMPAERGRPFLVMADAMSGVAHARSGRLVRAATHLSSTERVHRPAVPFEHWLYKVLEGEIALARGEFDKAARAFAEGEPPVRAYGFGPGIANNPPFREGLARVAEAKGDLAGAIARYRDLLTQSPEHKWQALFQPIYVLEIARLLERTGDRQSARQEYERFLEIWSRADADRPELAEARAAVARLR